MLQYADDRPWPGSTGWSDAVSRGALDVIAEGVEHMAGFRVCCINIVHRGVLRAVAMGGTDEQRELLMDSHTPVSAMETELEQADVWGRFLFVPAGRVPDVRDWGATFDVETLDGPDAWHPEDVLAAPIRDGRGTMVGLLSVDLPVSGRRPTAAELERLERYAELVEGAVLMALEHDEQQERVQMSRAARQVVSAATRELSMDTVVSESAQALLSGFASMGLWLHTFGGELYAAVRAQEGEKVSIPTPFIDVAETVARAAWAERRVGILSHTEWTHTLDEVGLGDRRELVLDFLAGVGVGSILFVPLGAGSECLGALVLARGLDQPRWTAVETEAARDIGLDLGSAILNARTFEREQQAVAELQALDSYKSQLVATLSHELKTPITSILGNLELLEDGDASGDDTARSISAISRGADRLVRVVDDLMLLAKVGDPGNQLISRPVDLAEVVEDVIELTAATARQRQVTVSFTTPDEAHTAAGDADELDRVVTNLLSNALKYTPAHGRVRLALTREGTDVVLTCSDTGIGIAEADLGRLFREFFRSADPAAQGQPGTGLGLAIVDGIVRRHSGRIEVTSTVGVGTTFTVRLPSVVPLDGASRERRTASPSRH